MLRISAVGWHFILKYFYILNKYFTFIFSDKTIRGRFFRNYFTPIKNQLMILLLTKLSLDKFATLQLSLNKLPIIYYLTVRQFIVNRADL